MEYFELKKIDINRERRNGTYYAKFPWPVFNVMDHPEPFGGEIRCGLFFVETTATCPFRGVGWYGEPLVKYGIEEGLINISEIKLQLIPSKTLPPDYFQYHIDELEKVFDDPTMQKLAPNTFIGLLGRTRHEQVFTYLSLNAAEAAGKFASNETGYECYVREHGVTLPDGRIVWRADFKHEVAMDRTAYPMYKQVLEMEAVELHKMIRLAESVGGFVCELATDAILYLSPLPLKGILQQTTLDESCRVPKMSIDIGAHFWDDARERPKYKFEDPSQLRAEHSMMPRKLPALGAPVSWFCWHTVMEDSADHDWKAVAAYILDKRISLNIDGRAGVGKSSLTRAILDLLLERFDEECFDFVFEAMAPTNTAAQNIGGRTIHSFEREWKSAQTRGGKAMQRLQRRMQKMRYIIVDEISMLHSWFYALLTSVKVAFSHIKMILVGDFEQLLPVLDEWEGDYKNSAALHHLCDGNRFQLTICRRADRTLFDLCCNVWRVDPDDFPVTELTWLNIAYTHETRKRENARCMAKFCTGKTVRIAADPKDEHSQAVAIFVGMPILVYKTCKKAEEFNSQMWEVVELGEEGFKMRKNLEDADLDKGLGQNDMPVHETKYADFHVRCRPGFCITVYAAQGKTFKERFTIFDWDFIYMIGRGQYVALSRAKTVDQVQIDSPHCFFETKRQRVAE